MLLRKHLSVSAGRCTVVRAVRKRLVCVLLPGLSPHQPWGRGQGAPCFGVTDKWVSLRASGPTRLMSPSALSQRPEGFSDLLRETHLTFGGPLISTQNNLALVCPTTQPSMSVCFRVCECVPICVCEAGGQCTVTVTAEILHQGGRGPSQKTHVAGDHGMNPEQCPPLGQSEPGTGFGGRHTAHVTWTADLLSFTITARCSSLLPALHVWHFTVEAAAGGPPSELAMVVPVLTAWRKPGLFIEDAAK